jgi:hypothetical protein
MSNILPDVAAMQAEIAKLKAELANAAANKNKITCKVQSEGKDGKEPSGAVSVYGLNAKFPVTLYAAQWERLFASETVAMIKATIAAGDKAGTVTRRDKPTYDAPAVKRIA